MVKFFIPTTCKSKIVNKIELVSTVLFSEKLRYSQVLLKLVLFNRRKIQCHILSTNIIYFYANSLHSIGFLSI